MDLQVPVRSSKSTAALLTQNNCVALAVCAHTRKTRRCTLHVSLAMFCSLTLLHPIVLWAFLPVVMIIGLSLVESQTLWGVVHTHCKAGTHHCKHINTQIEVLLQKDGGVMHHHKAHARTRAHTAGSLNPHATLELRHTSNTAKTKMLDALKVLSQRRSESHKSIWRRLLCRQSGIWCVGWTHLTEGIPGLPRRSAPHRHQSSRV